MTEVPKSEGRTKDDDIRSWRGARVEIGEGTKRELDLVAAVKRRLEEQKGQH